MKLRVVRALGICAIAGLLLIWYGSRAARPGPPSKAVASLYDGPGFVGYSTAWSVMPRLVIYADGRVIVTTTAYVDGEYTRSVEQGRVAPAEVCALLARIEAAGFFEYDPASYPEFVAADLGTTEISVDAGRARQVSAYGLGLFLTPAPEDWLKDTMRNLALTFPDSLSETYRLLADYRPADPAPYRPDRVALLIDMTGGDNPAPSWPLFSPSLFDLLAAARIDGRHLEVVLEGRQAAAVYDLFGRRVTQTYADGDRRYRITVRPLLPQETWEPQEGWGRNARFAAAPEARPDCAR